MERKTSLRYRSVAKFLFAVLLSFVIGMSVGMTKVFAETKTGIYVPGAGNVGTIATEGYFDSSGWLHARGRTASSVSLYYTSAHIKIWHPVSYILQDSKFEDWYWSTGGRTLYGFATGTGDTGTTRSVLRYSTSSGSTVRYDTSYPNNGVGGCYNHWKYGWSC